MNWLTANHPQVSIVIPTRDTPPNSVAAWINLRRHAMSKG
jgi:hypothetical protein